MSIKITRVIYPHIVKQYETVEQLVNENGYNEFYNARRQELIDFGVNLNDSSVYLESLSEDGFEGILTMVFENQESYDAYFATVVQEENFKMPIFIEDAEEHLI